MQKQIKVYTASKTNHAAKWLALRAEWPEVHFTARWPSMVVAGVPEAAYSAMQFWQDDLEDVRASDVVLVYSELVVHDERTQQILESGFTGQKYVPEYEKLRGALVEAGMGLALGKRVIVVGDAPDYGTWQFHPLCYKVDNLEQARYALRLLLQTTAWDREGLLNFIRSMKVPSDF